MQINEIPTPAYVLDEAKLIQNLKILQDLSDRTGCKILLAQKAFSMYCEYPLIGQYLFGTAASSLYEAKLGREEMGKETHIFSPAYKESEMDEIVSCCDHIVFNSVSQLLKFRPRCQGKLSMGLRVNPEHSTQREHPIYDPCAPGSRLGVTEENLKRALDRDPDLLEGVDGLHFHCLCEQNADDLETTLRAVEQRFKSCLKEMKWINMGGGQHITKENYDMELLEHCIRHMQKTYGLEVYLEPGEAVALDAGYLVTEVLDTVQNSVTTLILDTSAACHMPDVLEMPYRPPLEGSGKPGEKTFTYRLSSCSCLAGDVIGDYSFDCEIVPGDRLYFGDMAIYTMVKNNSFNGMRLPSIYVMDENGECRLIKEFGYSDFKERLS